MKMIIFAIVCIFALSGCAVPLPPDTNERLGQFTAASSFNVRNLNYEKVTGTATHIKGKSCYEVDLRTLAYVEGPKDDLVQRAMDGAIRSGQDSGLDGDLLVNVRIERGTEYFDKKVPFLFGHINQKTRNECVYVDGDLVKIKTYDESVAVNN